MNQRIFNIYYKIKRVKNSFKLKQKDFSIITNNCLAGKLYHDFKMEFNSPIINLQMTPEDFVKFCENMQYYLLQDFVQVTDMNEECYAKFRSVGGGEIDFPVAQIGDLHLFLQHYKSYEDAKESWNRRSKRVNTERCYYILVSKEEHHLEALKKFSEIPLQKKLILMIDNLPEELRDIKEIFCLNVPKGIHFMDRVNNSGMYYYEKFPFAEWFNECDVFNVR